MVVAASASTVGVSPQPGHDEIGLFACIIGSPRPNTDTLRAVLDSLIHGQPLIRRVFGRHNHVDVALALDTVIKAGQQAVAIRRQIAADDICLFAGDMIKESRILMRETVVVLLPYVGRKDEVERGNILSPRKFVGDFQPLCVLGDHGVHNTDEGLIGCEETMTACKDIAFKPALAHMLGEICVHDASLLSDIVVLDIHAIFGSSLIVDLCLKGTRRYFKRRIHTVGHRLVGTEHTEVAALLIEFEDVADVLAEFEHILRLHRSGSIHLDAVLREIGQTKIL